MEPTRNPSCSVPNTAPIKEQRGPVLFMLFLLIVSGLTATVVGYRVKSADIERKAQLLELYQSLGGTFESAHALGQTISAPTMPLKQQYFVLAYEVNSRARAHGLYRFIETSSPEIVEGTIRSLFSIGAVESAHSTEDAWKAFREPNGSGTTVKSINPKAARFARQYDRYLARDTEVKLFAYSRDNRDEIAHASGKNTE